MNTENENKWFDTVRRKLKTTKNRPATNFGNASRKTFPKKVAQSCRCAHRSDSIGMCGALCRSFLPDFAPRCLSKTSVTAKPCFDSRQKRKAGNDGCRPQHSDSLLAYRQPLSDCRNTQQPEPASLVPRTAGCGNQPTNKQDYRNRSRTALRKFRRFDRNRPNSSTRRHAPIARTPIRQQP